MNRLFKITIIMLTVALFVSPALAKKPDPKPPEPNPYCCAPPFIMEMANPNILIMVQMNESMYRRASASINNGQYDSTVTYYGYFNPERLYAPTSAGGWKSDGVIPGNILNWAIMSRIDIARRALFAAAGQPSSQVIKIKVLATGGPDTLMNSAWPCTLVYYGTSPPAVIEFSKPDLGNITIRFLSGNIAGISDVTVPTIVRYDTDPDPWNYEHYGIVHLFGDENTDKKWDEDAPRMGLMFFSDQYSAQVMKEVIEPEQAPSVADFTNQINNKLPDGQWANPGEAILEAIHYIKYTSDPHFDAQNYTWHGVGSKQDPWYTYKNPEPVWCRRSFLVIIGDGEAHEDNPSIAACAHLPPGPLPRAFWDYDGDANPKDNVVATDPTGLQNPADDYALYGHVTDLRDDLDDINNVTVYTLMAFGTQDALYKEIAKNGGFKDLNGDNLPGPSQSEWDEDGDSIPDNFFMANTGDELENAMAEIFEDILTKVNSASGVAVVTTGMKGGGSTVQSQFYPQKKFPTGEKVSWIGNTHSLWLDPFGWIREDTDADAILHLQNDHVVNMEWNTSVQNVLVTRFRDVAGTGDPSQFDTIGTVPVEQLRPIWQAGEWLWNAAAGDRTIYTFVDSDDDGLIEGAELMSFEKLNSAVLQPYMDIATLGETDSVIDYIRGVDFPNMRTRTADGKVWKLGDIMNSGAVAVQPAIERYDFIYGDNSYVDYYDQYLDRRQAIYVGANDGMLHCFNGGVRVDLPSALTPFELDPAGHALGEELWAYIPQNLLAHLKWLKDSSYCHVYYVDMKPYATDAQIFADDATHPNGWGTILIGGMRIGGLDIKISNTETLSSAYFAIDVTDPLNPVPLWEFTEPDLHLTVCYPTVIKVKNSWYLIFGSGPENCAGEAAVGVKATVYVLDLATGALRQKWEFPDDQSFVTNIFGVDWGMDYSVDRIYFGDCYYDLGVHGNWGGKIYRIETNDETNPALWDTSFVFNVERPITAEGSIATDDYNHLWVYFGTGRFFSEVDEVDTTTQRYVGFRDDTTHAATVAGLYNVTDVKIDTNDIVHFPAGGTGTFPDLIDTVNAHCGWWREHMGIRERNLTTTLVFGGAVLYTTYLPSVDICAYGGTGRLYALYYRTGTAHINPSFLKAEDDTLYHPYCVDVGQGMPSEPSLYVSGDQIKVFIQASGGIVTPETGLPGLPRTGVILWKGR